MNWRLGLHRVSAVFWGFWALMAVLFTVVLALDEARTNSFGYAAGYSIVVGGFLIGLVVLAHRLTCWIINGFFTAK